MTARVQERARQEHAGARRCGCHSDTDPSLLSIGGTMRKETALVRAARAARTG